MAVLTNNAPNLRHHLLSDKTKLFWENRPRGIVFEPHRDSAHGRR